MSEGSLGSCQTPLTCCSSHHAPAYVAFATWALKLVKHGRVGRVGRFGQQSPGWSSHPGRQGRGTAARCLFRCQNSKWGDDSSLLSRVKANRHWPRRLLCSSSPSSCKELSHKVPWLTKRLPELALQVHICRSLFAYMHRFIPVIPGHGFQAKHLATWTQMASGAGFLLPVSRPCCSHVMSFVQEHMLCEYVSSLLWGALYTLPWP